VAADGVMAAQIDPTIDAGIVPTYAIGDYVWSDTDQDGIQDAGETGIANVVVTLTDASGNPVNHINGTPVTTTQTDGSGKYHFDQLPEGDYVVKFTAPIGTTITGASAGSDRTLDSNPNGAGVSPVVHLGPSDANLTASNGGDGVTSPQIDRTIDAGIVPLYAIGDFVWTDANGNGVQDSGETGIPGLTVTLKDGTGTVIGTAITGPQGQYHFDQLPAGDYTVVFTAPSGDVFTTKGAGTDQGVDSNPDATGTAQVHLGPTDTNVTDPVPGDGVMATKIDRTIDAGVVPTYAIGDYVWTDTNLNGIQDAGEAPVAGVEVTLTDASGNPVKDANGVTVAPVNTAADGSYHFDQLVAGTYRVVFQAPAGTNFTTPVAGTDQTKDSNPDATGVATVVLGPSDVNLTASVAGPTGDHVASPRIDRTIDAGVVPAPSNPSLRVEKYDGTVDFTPKVSVSTASKDTDAPAGDADTASAAITADAGSTTAVKVTFNNNGDVPLYDVTVIDETTSGTGTVSGLSCIFPDGSKGLYFAGPLLAGVAVRCTGTLAALGDGAAHQDQVTVYARPGVTTAGVPGPNPANPPTGQPIKSGDAGTVSDKDLFNVKTAPAAVTTTTSPTTTTVAPTGEAPDTVDQGSGSPLAFTGLNSWAQILMGLGLLSAGVVATVAGRRRRRNGTA
jgi:hypothetical protein